MRRLEEAPYVECELCEMPRRGDANTCPFCAHTGDGKDLGGIPTDFALRLVADGCFEAASGYLEGELAAGRETPEGALVLAWISLITNDLRAVEVWSHESLRLHRDQAGPHILLGLVFERGQRWEEAAREYSLALNFTLPPARQSLLASRRAYCEKQIPEW